MNGKAIAGFIGLLVFIMVLFILALNFLRGPETTTSEVQTTQPVSDVVNSRSEAEFFRRGRLNSNEEHSSYRITIDESSRTLEILDGYQYVVTKKYTYKNNTTAYEEFLFALERQGLANVADGDEADTRGVCANGALSEYTVREGSDVIAYQWTSDCGLATTEAAGINALYQNQIPDFFTKIATVRL